MTKRREMSMRVELTPLARCLEIRHAGNPKAHELAQIKASIRRFGFVQPPLIDDATNTMTAGHGRCEALEQMRVAGEVVPSGVSMSADGSWIIPVLRGISFASERERDAYVIADNKLPELGGWDMAKLVEMVENFEPEDFEGIGINEDELAEWLGDEDGDEPPPGDGREIQVGGHTRVIGGHKVRPPAQMTNDDWTLHLGDCLEGLKKLPDNSVDAIVTDPPAGISFMGREWDDDKGGRDKWIEWLRAVMTECIRVLKPGGHILSWALPRTSHWTAMALELAGFQIRDRVSWLYVTGFPKSMNVSKAIDAHLGAERPVVGHREDGRSDMHAGVPGSYGSFDITESATEEAKQWEGWGTALKPACEDWWLARKPPEGTLAENLIKWGVGALNIEDSRIGDEGGTRSIEGATQTSPNVIYGKGMGGVPHDPDAVLGRWPSHLIVGEGVAIDGLELPAMYFYVPKPSKGETEAGLQNLPLSSGAEVAGRAPDSAGMNSPRAGVAKGARANTHPTKKPIALMRYLIHLITPPPMMVCASSCYVEADHVPALQRDDQGVRACPSCGGNLVERKSIVLDPFSGSGTTGLAALVEGCRFVGFEMSPEYHAIACERLRSIIEDPRQADAVDDDIQVDAGANSTDTSAA